MVTSKWSLYTIMSLPNSEYIFVINSKVTSLSVVATGEEHLFSEDREETGSLVQRVNSHNTIIRGATLSGHITAS